MQRSSLILIVEDDASQARALEAELRSAGYVTVAGDGGTAPALAGSLLPDLILLGLRMPAGGEFMRLRNASGRLRNIPVVLTASSPGYESELPEGIDAVLPRPATREQLLTRVAVSLRRGEPGALSRS